jgi:hypothetical protein
MVLFSGTLLNRGAILNLGYASRLQGVCKQVTGGTQNLKSPQKGQFQSLIFITPNTNGETQSARFLFRGYAKEENKDLEVREYQKVENPWNRALTKNRVILCRDKTHLMR